MRIVIVPHESGTPSGKLADVELHFDARDGLLKCRACGARYAIRKVS